MRPVNIFKSCFRAQAILFTTRISTQIELSFSFLQNSMQNFTKKRSEFRGHPLKMSSCLHLGPLKRWLSMRCFPRKGRQGDAKKCSTERWWIWLKELKSQGLGEGDNALLKMAWTSSLAMQLLVFYGIGLYRPPITINLWMWGQSAVKQWTWNAIRSRKRKKKKKRRWKHSLLADAANVHECDTDIFSLCAYDLHDS